MSFFAQQQAAQKNLSWVLAGKLAQRILRGEYAPGRILPGEIELGELFGVSRTAVREAIKTLAAKGMLLPRPRIGTRVLPQNQWNFFDKELLTWWIEVNQFSQVVDEFLVMRRSLEPQACSLAATQATHEQKTKLLTIMSQMHALKHVFDRQQWVDVDMAFHEHIYEMSHNPFLRSFSNLFRSVYYNYFKSVVNNDVVKLDLHQAIVDAIVNVNGNAAYSACITLLNAPVPER
ncbi:MULTISPECIES: FadR/GntR family transcriptional regulator [Tenebrionibacter/Tenebrionicola group]|jgi:DNA-binding FadR family transcriptional regulator|uniref:FadR family transcriptional regulator n=2 Tax=Tenebrionibacter/Tenebrionicola group TaxID=2969848 RepID=A0A8K0XY85_9ENTR|nr:MULTISPECIES: FadR/GntR family transcriptional regulator [Tenebrionibacter/Tenebrionicola group]MBK4714289.1 FadR family transcriptional regulator [Tenebrionibacter intestinalis]MBV5095304.1 FadR family transcriptional regulator [Tenebrionicola larvae]